MNYQEALETLKAIPIGDCFLLDYKSIKGCGCRLETEKALETLQELIDKETPKKVVKESEEYPSYIEVSYECPTCKENLNFNKYIKRCLDCGQLLDWSENE